MTCQKPEKKKETDDEEEEDETSECFVFMYIWL